MRRQRSNFDLRFLPHISALAGAAVTFAGAAPTASATAHPESGPTAAMAPLETPTSAPVTFAAPQSKEVPPAEVPLYPPRLERWLEDGDKELITQTFRRHPELVLAFFDRYLETGMKLIEDKASYEDFMKELRKGVKFAQLATDAWRDPIFAEYAANFASWNAPERKNFRAGQAAYAAGARAMKGGKAAEARVQFQASLELAEPLGDAWGLQMAMGGLAKAALALQDWTAANDASLKAVDISSRLQMREDELEYLLICVEAREQLKTPDSGVGHGRVAWTKLKASDSPELRARVGEAFAAALERTGKSDEAASVREEACVEPAKANDSEGAAAPDATPATP